MGKKEDNPRERSQHPWYSFRGDVKNSGISPRLDWSQNKDAEFTVSRFRTGNGIFSTPVIDAEEKIYVGSADRKFYALDPLTGTELWHKDIGGIIDSAACLDDRGNVYLAGGDGKIHAYKREDGTELWSKDFLKERSKEQFSFSSNFWFEANIVMGPDGYLYAANDDFFLYKLSPDDGSIIWMYQTSFLIWAAPSFSTDGCVYMPGFDHNFYAIDMETGKLRWKLDLHGSLVSSAAVAGDGTVFVSSFNGNVYSIDTSKKKGKKKWEFFTGGHVYASPAISSDGTVYVGSTSGTFFAIDAASGEQKWSFYIGDAIRASAALGPDPEGKEPCLIYFGGGDGVVYALTPDGQLRWAYDILPRAQETDYPNLNGSMALGFNGLSICSAGGDIIWIPYDHYLNNGDDEGFIKGKLFKSRKMGHAWHYVTPGGKILRESITSVQEILPVNTISIRLLEHEENGVQPATIDPASIKLEVTPEFEFRFELQSNGSTINIFPREILQPATAYTIKVRVSCGESTVQEHEESLVFETSPVEEKKSIVSLKGNRFDIVKMALPQPPIIPSLNQIGFASLVIPFTIVAEDDDHRKFVAWAVQKFADFVPQERTSVYGFSGHYNGEYFMMEAKDCLFEITSFNISLDMLRFASKIEPDGSAGQGGSMIVDKYWGTSTLKLLSELGASSPITTAMMLAHLKRVGLRRFLSALFPFIGSLLRQLLRNTWNSWGLINHRAQLIGVGTFKIEKGGKVESKDGTFEVLSFERKGSRKLEAMIKSTGDEVNDVFRIFLIDKSKMEVLPINYSNCNKQLLKGDVISISLSIPKKVAVPEGNCRAFLMHDLSVMKELDF
ncbi:MAG: PQQ-binding-like beta-propeller repeat protein [Candidatus Hodarchaeota archaeon]